MVREIIIDVDFSTFLITTLKSHVFRPLPSLITSLNYKERTGLNCYYPELSGSN